MAWGDGISNVKDACVFPVRNAIEHASGFPPCGYGHVTMATFFLWKTAATISAANLPQSPITASFLPGRTFAAACSFDFSAVTVEELN